MVPAENLRDWRGEKVIDPAGDKIGHGLGYQPGASGDRRLGRR